MANISNREEAARNFRWDPYFIRRGYGFKKFWEEYFSQSNRNVLYVLGRGFDPRMCAGPKIVLNAGGDGVRNCLSIDFDEGGDSPSRRYASRVSSNVRELSSLLKGRGEISNKTVRMWSKNGTAKRRISSRSAAEIFSSYSDLSSYSDIVIDVSSMPRAIYFPLIGKAIYLLDKLTKDNLSRPIPNLHVIVCEDHKMDKMIRNIGIDDTASYVHGFGGLEMEATAEIPTAWIPILGENQRDQLERINTLVNPVEICPVLPSPSVNPRRGDELLIEYRELLFDVWLVEPRNIIYASEQNPFEVYHQIHQTVRHYDQALKPLGGCKVAVSAVSSKLLSLGALLATYELKEDKGMDVSLAHVESQGYDMSDDGTARRTEGEEEMFVLWLVGDCYEP